MTEANSACDAVVWEMVLISHVYHRGFLSGAEDKQLCWEVICLLLDGTLELLQGLGGVALSSGPLLGMLLLVHIVNSTYHIINL